MSNRSPRAKRIYILVLFFATVLLPFYYGSPIFGERISYEEGAVYDGEVITLGDLGLFKTELIYVGRFRATGYTNSPDENDGYVDSLGRGITKTGNPVQAGYTAAVLHGSIPYETKLYIPALSNFINTDVENCVRIVDDCGVGKNQIDIAFKSKEEAMNFGVQWLDVYVIKYVDDMKNQGAWNQNEEER